MTSEQQIALSHSSQDAARPIISLLNESLDQNKSLIRALHHYEQLLNASPEIINAVHKAELLAYKDHPNVNLTKGQHTYYSRWFSPHGPLRSPRPFILDPFLQSHMY